MQKQMIKTKNNEAFEKVWNKIIYNERSIYVHDIGHIETSWVKKLCRAVCMQTLQEIKHSVKAVH